ncbi:MAG: lysine--tRNA ligase [Candidatus Pacebacteria bacterium]|nr:lysine--tRNA ligase [Candidatus Paceibacterota bacterium]MDD2757243.1 lysine--tRNA ligase [Candidatus Paceibacterota bacterium]MDD3283781.1 lysine--tRNA ligase [Candidatus Paceibacterota bacterium]MDD3969987.1 lysine--tRNA ligase [Candidatus Paceibacterota bacterium]MDD4738042.1 lysine--tRNA ligase [Candidatus Paceibacterota bacterium]
MSVIDEIRENRKNKSKRLKESGIDPYPIEIKRTCEISEALRDFDLISKEEKEIILVGRMKTIRTHGGLTFIDFEDGTAKIQGLIAKDKIGTDFYDLFLEMFDMGDFIQARGTLFETKRGEKTMQIADCKIITKSLRALPEKWHGLKDVEERFRKRYLDLMFSPEVKNNFVIRSNFIKELRSFLNNEGFLEVETPILQLLYGGARAKPFKTHINAMDLDVYLRISPELYLKRLLVGGFEKVYEIGKCFRNEGVDKFHNPDFTMIEFYWAYADYKQLMKMTEKMLQTILTNVIGGTEIEYNGEKISFDGEWERIEFFALLEKYTGIKYEELNEEALLKKGRELGVDIPDGADKPNIADEIYKKYCRPKIIQPTFVIHHPKGFQPLAKSFDKDKLASFALVIHGAEVVNAFSELNDPMEQEDRLKSQEKLFSGGFEEAQRSDEDFVEALEYGMPPAAGFGMGIDRIISIITNSNSLREIILFPLMKDRD